MKNILNKISTKQWILFADIVLFLLLLEYLPFDPLVVKGLSLLAFIAILWLTEAIHISVTALLVPILAVLLKIFPTADAFKSFADPVIFLFLGGFALASALSKQGLDRMIAGFVLNMAKGRLSLAIYLLFAVAAGLSMWISNTATAAMMLPLMLGVLGQLDHDRNARTWTFALLGIAYCSSIGGIATLVGSPPNAIAAANTGMSFVDWLVKALPISLILLPSAVIVMHFVLKPDLSAKITNITTESITWNSKQKITLAIFSATVICWVFSVPLNHLLGSLASFDSLVAIAALIALCVFGVVRWQDVDKTTDWGVLILFGGGLCLSAVLKVTGASTFLGEALSHTVGNSGPFIALLVIATFVVILTEFASNTASAALLVPVFAAVAPSLGLDPVALATLIAVAASCAFMLPVATPPNAIVFGTGFVPQKAMIRVGLWLNLVCIILLSLYSYLFW